MQGVKKGRMILLYIGVVAGITSILCHGPQGENK